MHVVLTLVVIRMRPNVTQNHYVQKLMCYNGACFWGHDINNHNFKIKRKEKLTSIVGGSYQNSEL